MAINAKLKLALVSGPYEWHEVYWLNPADLDTAWDRAANLTTRRRALLGTGARIVYASVSDEDVRGDSEVNWSKTDFTRAVENACTEPWIAMLVRLTGRVAGTNGSYSYRANHFLRGMPANVVRFNSNGGVYLVQAYQAALDTFLAYIKNPQTNFQIRVNDRGQAVKPITKMVSGAADESTIYTVAGHGLNFSDQVLIHGFQKSLKVNNGVRYILNQASPDTIEVSDAFVDDADFKPGASMQDPNNNNATVILGPSVQFRTNIYVPVAGAEYLHITSRAVGKSKLVSKTKIKNRPAPQI
jgi:hypothetical protein